jgi:hypothetical protein
MNALSVSLIVLVHLLAGGLIQQNGRELPKFDEYRAEDSFEGPPAALATGSSRLARAYRTRLREGVKAGPNFAGHFTLVAWGCGSSCQEWAIVDARTGRVFDWLVRSTAGAEFYPNSRLLIVDSPKRVAEMFGGSVPADCAVCGTPDAYEWSGTEWRAIAGADVGRIRKY